MLILLKNKLENATIFFKFYLNKNGSRLTSVKWEGVSSPPKTPGKRLNREETEAKQKQFGYSLRSSVIGNCLVAMAVVLRF